jgi:hypothetical protein
VLGIPSESVVRITLSSIRCDSVGGVVEKDGKKVVVLTDHGMPYFPNKDQLRDLVHSYDEAKKSILPFIYTAEERVRVYTWEVDATKATLLEKDQFLYYVMNVMATDQNGDYFPVKDGLGDWGCQLFTKRLNSKSQEIPEEATHIAWYKKAQ